jgi:NADPH:quinone reductase-like Zn-dependent oxidoreductase
MTIKAGTLKWQAAPEVLFCIEKTYEPYGGRIALPATATKGVEKLFQVVSVGPGVQGFNEGDFVAADKAYKAASGCFVRIRDVLGRLAPNDAPNSAIAKPKVDDAAEMPRAGEELKPEIDGEKLQRDMAAAD